MSAWLTSVIRRRARAASAVLAALAAGLLLVASSAARPLDLVIEITSGPSGDTTDTNATFGWVIKVRGVSSVQCQLDAERSEVCTPPKRYSGLSLGQHRFLVRAFDAGGSQIGSDSRSWKVVESPQPPPPPPPKEPVPPSPLPDFKLELLNASLAPFTLKASTFAKPAPLVRVVRIGGSNGPLVYSVKLAPSSSPGVAPGIAENDHANPTELTVNLKAPNGAKASSGTLVLTASPKTPLSGPSPRTLAIPFKIVEYYDLAVTGIDVTQGIQPEQALPAGPSAGYAGVPLVKRKRTIARVFAVATPLGTTVAGARILLHGERLKSGYASEKLPGSPLNYPLVTLTGGFNVPVGVPMLQKGKPAAIFKLPSSWTEDDQVLLRAEVLPPQLLLPGSGSECGSVTCAQNNRYTLFGISFHDTGYVSVWPIWARIPGGAFLNFPTDQPFPGNPKDLLAHVNQLLPLADGELRGYGWAAWFDPTKLLKMGMFYLSGCEGNECNLASYLKSDGNHRDIEMVMIDDTPVPTPFGVFGVNDHHFAVSPFQFAAHGVVNLKRPFTSMAHETGHALGRQHASSGCGGSAGDQNANPWTDAWGLLRGIGFDVRDGTVIYDGSSGYDPGKAPIGSSGKDGAWFDFMSYCAWENAAWISPRNWGAYLLILEGIESLRNKKSFAARALQSRAAATLSVRGLVEHGQVIVTRVAPGSGAPTKKPESEFKLVLRSRGGAVLTDWPMTITNSEGHGHAATFLSADVALPPLRAGQLPADLGSVEIVSHGEVKARAVRSTSPPTARLISPNGGTVGKGRSVTVRWAAVDLDPGAQLAAAIDYSSNGGTTWRQVHAGPNAGRVTLPSTFFSASRNVRLRLRVSDGFDETQVLSKRLVAVGRPPQVDISSPTRPARFFSDAQIDLGATAYDDAGAFLDGKSVVWFDGNRRVATGRLASAHGLKPGAHVIRAVARDRLGRTGSASVRIRIMPARPAIIVKSGPNKLRPKARMLHLRLACTVPAVLSTAGPSSRGARFRAGCTPKARSLGVPIHPGHNDLRLVLHAKAPGAPASSLTLVVRRRSA